MIRQCDSCGGFYGTESGDSWGGKSCKCGAPIYWAGYWAGYMASKGYRKMTPEESKWCKDNKIFECADSTSTSFSGTTVVIGNHIP